VAVGAAPTTTDRVTVRLAPAASVAVRPTEKAPAAAYVCWIEAPGLRLAAAEASPKLRTAGTGVPLALRDRLAKVTGTLARGPAWEIENAAMGGVVVGVPDTVGVGVTPRGVADAVAEGVALPPGVEVPGTAEAVGVADAVPVLVGVRVGVGVGVWVPVGEAVAPGVGVGA
jgi:hypothetical protein